MNVLTLIFVLVYTPIPLEIAESLPYTGRSVNKKFPAYGVPNNFDKDSAKGLYGLQESVIIPVQIRSGPQFSNSFIRFKDNGYFAGGRFYEK